MCGIVGFITEEGPKGARARAGYLEQGLIADILRGEDSTGVFYGSKDQKEGTTAAWLKDATDGYTFTKHPKYARIDGQMSTIRYAVGHNRAATIGNISVDTAHPFQEGLVTGVHNGTVRGGMATLPIPMYKAKGTVDSHCIIQNLEHVDPGDAAKAVLSKIDGAYALVWYDGRDGTLNMARNDTRTFHLAQSYDQDTILFASESGMLQWLAERNHLGIGDVTYLVPGNHLKFTPGSLEPEVIAYTPAPKYKAPVSRSGTSTHNTGGSSNYSMRWRDGSAPGVKVRGKQTNRQPDANRILVGGIRRDIPQKLQAGLLDMELAVEDRLTFTPMQAQSTELLKRKSARRYVTGFLDSLSTMALVYNVEDHVIKSGFDRRWTVRPIGVQFTDRERTRPMVVCQLVASTQQVEILTLQEKKRQDKQPLLPDSTEDDLKASPNGYKGPEGLFFSKDDWMEMTEDGCGTCGKPIHLLDAPDIAWDRDIPQCVDCFEDELDVLAMEQHYGWQGMDYDRVH
jgi:hypothetical protein